MFQDGRKRHILIIGSVLLVLLLALGIWIGYRFITHEYKQQERIADLETELSDLAEQNNALKNRIEILEHAFATKSWSTKNYNYLAIGNSITLHDKCDYWWNECGMAASTLDNDYVHQLSTIIKESEMMKYALGGADVDVCAVNLCFWETQYSDRSEMLTQLDGYLDDRLNLVTIQLGENASDLSTFESDFVELIEYVKERCPFAQIVVVGDFWEYEDRDAMKEMAAEICGVDYVSLSEIKNNSAYCAGLGTVVYGDDGGKHEINHEGVAAHPGDEAMKYIAERIYEKIYN